MKKILVLAVALCMVATSAYAAEWNFYGSARVQTAYTNLETIGSSTDTTDFTMWNQTNARIGANVKASDELTGRFEYGASGGNANVRLLYGTWNFGGGSLTIGQDYDPLGNFISNSVYSHDTAALDDLNLLLWGNTYGGRNAQIKLQFGGFQIAAVTPKTALDASSGAVASSEVTFPKFVAAYRFAQDNWWAKIAGAYQTYDIHSGASQTGADVSVDSYLGNLSAGITFGPARLAGTVFAGQNAGNLILIAVNNAAPSRGGLAQYVSATNRVIDNDSFGYQLIAAYKASDMLTFETGVGSVETEFDIAGSREDDALIYYLQAAITLAPGVTISPEIGKVDYKQTGQTESKYIATRWMINF